MKHFREIAVLLAGMMVLAACEQEPRKPETGEDAQIKHAIVRYDAALIRAFRSLNINELEKVASDLEGSKNNAILVSFLADKIYMESDLLDMRVDSITVRDGSKAEAHVWESWTWRHLELNTGREVKPWEKVEQTLIYELVKDKEKGWIVDSVKIVGKTGQPTGERKRESGSFDINRPKAN